MQKTRYLIKVRKSRKSYFIIYLMIIAIISLLVYLYQNNHPPSKFSLIIAILFIILSIKITEIHRFRDWWAITNNSLIQSTGIFNKNVREIDFSSISDLDLDQSFFKRILNYGNVNVRLFLNETSIKIVDINKPSEFIEDLQKIMSMNGGRKGNAIRKI
jgi:membrane protein YdbS with pleckstrin-like domain